MAKAAKSKSKTQPKGKQREKTRFRPVRWAGFWLLRGATVGILLVLALIILFRFVNPPTTHTMWVEGTRLGPVKQEWVAIEDIAPVMARSAVAAEDADFCLHWGFDVKAIRAAIAQGGTRGGSTISQQVVKNVFLWQGRSWIRKALETAITPALETFWPKRRIIEVYLNIAELDAGVFGVGAAAEHYFGVQASALSAQQAALLAAILPLPKQRSASKPSPRVKRRAAAIVDGAATIRADGRAACFED